MKKLTPVGTAAALFVLAALPVQSQTTQSVATAPVQQSQISAPTDGQQKPEAKPLNNKVCPVSNQAVGSMGPAKVVEHKGYKINLCCDGCVKKFNKDPDAFLQAALIETKNQPQQPQQQVQPNQMQMQHPMPMQMQMQHGQQSQPQDQSTTSQQNAAVKPLNNPNCPISGHPVGSMQKGSNVVYKGYQIGLCCDSCKAQFNKDPDKYLQEMLKANNQTKVTPAPAG